MVVSLHVRSVGKVRRIISRSRFYHFKWRSACAHQCHSFRPRISPQRLSELRRLCSSIPWWTACEIVSLIVPTLFMDSIVGQNSHYWVKGVCVFSSACHLHFRQNDRGLLRGTACHSRVEQIPKQNHRMLTWGKKVSRRFCDRTLDLSYYDLRTLPLSYISIVFLYNYSDCAKVRHPSCNNSRDENFDIKFRESQLITDL